jgi:alpha/beta superfamily hydrolase
MSSFSIDGPVGTLEARYTTATTKRTGAPLAILCHPHPQYGGSMDDAVLDVAESVLLAHDIDCVRFNFRGVGGSAGTFDHGDGETFDLLAVVHWTQADKGAARPLWLAGYSFGSAVVWKAASQVARLERVWLIAPPIGRMDYSPQPSLGARVDVFLGTDDAFADHGALDAWSVTAAPHVRLHAIDGGDHFFSGTARALRTAMTDAVSL